MGIQIDGSANTISGLAVGGLPNGSISSDDIASNAVTVDKLASTLDLSSNTVTLPNTSVTAGMLASTLDISGKTVTLPNTSVTAGMLASTLDISGKTVTLPNTSVTAGMLASTLDLSSKTVTLPSGTGGKILQVVTTPYTGQFSTSTANTYQQVTGLNCSITTSSASSRVLVMIALGQMSSVANGTASFAVSRDGTRILLGAVDGVRGTCSFKYCCPDTSHSDGTAFMGVDSPGAVGTYVYGLQAIAQGGATVYINRTQVNSNLTDSYENRGSSHITLMEIA